MINWKGLSGLATQQQDGAIIEIIKENKLPMSMGVMYNNFILKHPNSISYKTFYRKIKELWDRGILDIERITGKGGNRTYINKIK